MSNPDLAPPRREELVRTLMDARRAMGRARRAYNRVSGASAKAVVQAAKEALCERGPVWWNDGAPDWNRHLARNTPYAAWFTSLQMPPGTAT